MKLINKIWPVIFIIIFSLFSFTPFFVKGFFPVHDDTQVARVFEMGQSLKDGMFPVRWSKDLGYGFGYPIFNYYDPLSYYIGGAINAIGVDSLASTKVLMIAVIIISGLFMYLLASEFWGAWGGILSSLLYVYAPYHGVDIYVRGDFAESLAYAFIPLVFYGLFKTYKNLKWQYVLVTSISLAALIISHNLTALMISPFILLFAFYLIIKKQENKKKTAALIIFGIFTGLLISAFYSLPAIFEMKFTNVISQVGGGADFKDHFVCIRQLWTSPWGYGGSVKGCVDGLSFMIGKYHIIISFVVFLLSLIFLLSRKFLKMFEKDKEKLILIACFYFSFLFSVFLMLDFSKPVWDFLKPMSFIQYPWRFLILAVFFSSFVAGGFFWIIRKFIKDNFINSALGIILAFFIIFVSVKFFAPQVILEKQASDYTNLFTLKWTTSKISDEYMPPKFQKPKSSSQIADLESLNTKDFKISDITTKTQELKFNFNSANDTQEIIPLAYFPAWNAYVDGNKIGTLENKKGIQVNLKKGEHNLVFRFAQTPLEKAGNLVSVTGIVLLILGIISLRRKYE